MTTKYDQGKIRPHIAHTICCGLFYLHFDTGQPIKDLSQEIRENND